MGGEGELTADKIVKRNNLFSKDACRVFSEVYGRFAANMALTSLPIGGLYIAGGIAIKNPWLVDNEYFKKAFVNVSPRMERAINTIPLFLINDENFGLNGALFYLKLK